MDTYKFNTESPAAKRLVELVYGKLRELYDPSLSQDALAQYAVALVAKGWERKKICSKLVELLGDEGACNMLLDWLMPYVRSRKAEFVAAKPVSKPAGSSTTQAKPAKELAVSSKPAGAVPSASAAATSTAGRTIPVATPAALSQPPVRESIPEDLNDVEALLRDDFPSDLASDLENDNAETEHNVGSEPVSASVAAAVRDAAEAHAKSESRVNEHPAKTPPAPVGSDAGQCASPGLAADSKAAVAVRIAAPEGGGRKTRIKSMIQWPQDLSKSGKGLVVQAAAAELEARRARFGDVSRSLTEVGRDQRDADRTHVASRHDRQRSRSPPAAPRQRAPIVAAQTAARRRSSEDAAEEDTSPQQTRHADVPIRRRLRSVVSGSLDAPPPQDGTVDRSDVDAAASSRPSVFSRLFKGALPFGAAPQGAAKHAPKTIASALPRSHTQRPAPQATTVQHAEHDAPGGVGGTQRSIFERIGQGREDSRRISGVKRPVTGDQAAAGPSQEDPIGRSGVKAQRTTGSAVLTGTRSSKADTRNGRVEHAAPAATSAVASRHATARPAAATPSTAAAIGQAERAKVAAQVPLLAGVKDVPPPAVPVVPNATADPTASAAPRTTKPSAPPASGVQGAGTSVTAAVRPAAATAKPAAAVSTAKATANGVPSSGAQTEMAKLLQEMRKKKAEIDRIKGQIALREVVEERVVHPDMRTILVQGLHPNITKPLLFNFFRDCGSIVNVDIRLDDFTGMPCAAYVEFETMDAQQTALMKDRTLLLDQVVIVKPKVKSASGPPIAPRTAVAAGAAVLGSRPVKRLADAPALVGKMSRTWVRPVVPQPAAGFGLQSI